MTDSRPYEPSPIVALALGWVLPGAGHAYAGQWGKATFFFSAIMTLVVLGMILGHGTVFLYNQLWYAAQVCTGGPALLLTPVSHHMAKQPQPPPPPGSEPAYKKTDEFPGIDWAARLHETGTLYTAVAGFLNILIMMDAYLRLAYPRRGLPKEVV
jgi:hypothetical protein